MGIKQDTWIKRMAKEHRMIKPKYQKQIRILGLMTMGPRFGNPEDSRPYFIETRRMFEKIKKLNLPIGFGDFSVND